jgi:hypothetical protein
VLTSVTHTSPPPPPRKEATNQVIHKKYVFVCLVRPIKPKNLTNLAPPKILPLLEEFSYVFYSPIELLPSRSISHSINIIPSTSFPNAPSYLLAPKEAT